MGEDSTRRVTRRDLLRTVAAGTAASVGAGTAAGYHKGYAGVIETRGQYGIRLLSGVTLKPGYTRTGYKTEEPIPGLTTDDSPSELVVFVHRYGLGLERSREAFRAVNDALRGVDYADELVGYSWDSDLGKWWSRMDAAEKNGAKLAAFVRDYRRLSPGTTLRVIGHGFGVVTVAEALANFADAGDGTTIDTVDVLGAAIDDGSVALGDAYGRAIADHCGAFRSYYKTDDEFLGSKYPWHEWDHALGREGATGDSPGNYAEYDVTDAVASHDSYHRPETGCVDRVVANWD
ncbi:MAG: alpha/beta hydrolase [Haloarculaceae archaeon]